MNISEWYYLPVAALVNSFFLFFWNKRFAANKDLKRPRILGLIFLGSLLNAWGIDVVQKFSDVSSLKHVMQVSLGCWLMFAAASAAKHYAVNGWSKKNFRIDYGGDLIGFILMGLVVYVLT
ncbi:MAG: DUF1761 family protein [Bacteriovorax sp.]